MNNKDIKIEDYTSRWDFMADRAGVPRKPDPDAEESKYQIMGRFVGADWMDEINYLLKKYNGGYAFNFLTKLGHGNLPYTYEIDKNDMISAGIPLDAKFVSKIRPFELLESREHCPNLWKMIDWFGFKGKVLPKIHIQNPGEVFPFHFDDLTTHRNNDSGVYVDEDPNKYARIEVQLLDWDYGHMWGLENTYWSRWKAGDIMWHDWYSMVHGTANAGMTPRICLQVTGEVDEVLFKKLRMDSGLIDLKEL